MCANRKTCILLAAYNGGKFIREQIETICKQTYKAWDLYVSIDLSTDETLNIVQSYVNSHKNIFIVSSQKSFGSAGKNFYSLLMNTPLEKYDYVAFADQDDIWFENKLEAGIKVLQSGIYSGYSSSIYALCKNQKVKYVKKSYPQKLIDYKFESAGPGCTYLFTSAIGLLCKSALLDNKDLINKFYYHDWLVYYIARNNNLKWYIDPSSYIYYRQHANNDTGVNLGLKAMWKRIRLLTANWYFDQVYLLENTISSKNELKLILGARNGLRLKWLIQFPLTRRRLKDGILLCILVLFNFIPRSNNTN